MRLFDYYACGAFRMRGASRRHSGVRHPSRAWLPRLAASLTPGKAERRGDMPEAERRRIAAEFKNAVHRLSFAGKSSNVAPPSKCSVKIRPTLRVKVAAVMEDTAR